MSPISNLDFLKLSLKEKQRVHQHSLLQSVHIREPAVNVSSEQHILCVLGAAQSSVVLLPFFISLVGASLRRNLRIYVLSEQLSRMDVYYIYGLIYLYYYKHVMFMHFTDLL